MALLAPQAAEVVVLGIAAWFAADLVEVDFAQVMAKTTDDDAVERHIDSVSIDLLKQELVDVLAMMSQPARLGQMVLS